VFVCVCIFIFWMLFSFDFLVVESLMQVVDVLRDNNKQKRHRDG
jgi:hypothetical protein